MLPTSQDNPTGLHQRYNITKVDGGPVDPDAMYFVLRIDGNASADDPAHIAACQLAALTYCKCAEEHPHLAKMAAELRELVYRYREQLASRLATNPPVAGVAATEMLTLPKKTVALLNRIVKASRAELTRLYKILHKKNAQINELHQKLAEDHREEKQ
jgi:hypothetical protein